MLQRLQSCDEELLPRDGAWPRDRLEEIDHRFVAAIQAAFDQGLESPVVARATVQVKSSLNGSRRRAEEAAIGAAGNRLCSRKGEMAASEVLAFVRELCPNIDLACVRAGLAERFRQRGVRW